MHASTQITFIDNITFERILHLISNYRGEMNILSKRFSVDKLNQCMITTILILILIFGNLSCDRTCYSDWQGSAFVFINDFLEYLFTFHDTENQKATEMHFYGRVGYAHCTPMIYEPTMTWRRKDLGNN